MSILYRFRDIAGYLSKVADFDPHLHLALPEGLTPVEFRQDLWRQKTRLPVLLCGVVCVILCLAVLVELRLVTDTDGHRPGPILSVFPALIVHSELKSVHPGFLVAFIFKHKLINK